MGGVLFFVISRGRVRVMVVVLKWIGVKVMPKLGCQNRAKILA